MTEQPESDLSRNNEFIRHCALEKLPIFDSYKNLCKIRKNPNLDYVDFEWTYYQFYHGNENLTIQRSPENSSAVTFSDLPMDVLEKVVQKSALDDCLALRKVSHDLQNLADSTEVHCEKVAFTFESSFSMIRLGNTQIFYRETRDGLCRITSSRNAAQHEENRDFEKAMVADASTILNNPKLKIGELCLFEKSNEMYTEFEELLQSLNFQLDARSVRIFSVEDRIPPVLQFLKPGTLEDIRIEAEYGIDDLDDVVETEQWKMAKTLKWSRVPDGFGMEKILHFKEIRISPFEMTTENLVMVRDILLKSAHFESCFLGIPGDFLDFEDALKLFTVMSEDPAFDAKSGRFSIPNSRDYFQLWLVRNGDGNVSGLSIEKRLRI